MTPLTPPAFPGQGALLLSGPTASGKSAVALELAERLGGEIVSADSMQVFRGLDIGTAKPTAGERSRVRHHLVDAVGPGESFDTARWLEQARQAAGEILGRGKAVIVCGGTGLYFRAWLLGLDAPAPSDPLLRAELESTPIGVLLEELRTRDPVTHGRIDRHNPRRVVRAVEILRLTGQPLEVRGPSPAPPGSMPVVVLRRKAEDLRRRIDARVDAMFAAGLVGETQRLLSEGLGRDRTALQAIGYRQVVEHLDGMRDLAGTVALVKSRTWQYARRQMTWYRHQLPVRWVDVGEGDRPKDIADRVLQAVRTVPG